MKKLMIVFLLAVLASCQNNNSPGYYDEMELVKNRPSYYDEMTVEGEPFHHEEIGVSINNGTTNGWEQEEPIEQKIIKQADIGYEVENYTLELARIKALVKLHGGYISSESEENSNYRISNDLVIRIPVDRLDGFMDTLAAGPKRLDYKHISAQDVTKEYVDIEARLKTKKEVEKRFTEILQKAKSIEEILQVENQLRVIREEIEAKEGRLKYLENQVGMSTVDLNVYQNLDYKYIPKKGKSFGERIVKALDKGWKGLLNLIIGVVYLWPFLLLIAVVILLLRRYIRKRRANQQ